jgi:bifunctional UDP-N-acetylglucosamine pyrophosphorylase/glucosamine-1-phosphate N-acetyltransferase
MDATLDFKPEYCLQPELNGTGGALLATRAFLKNQACSQFIITMGDVPLVRKETYITLIEQLKKTDMAVLGFCPEDKKEYGTLDIENGHVNKIVESKYWKNFSIERQLDLKVCNSGIYAVRKNNLLKYLSILAEKPHIVDKKINGRIQPIKEYFITDLVEHMTNDGLKVGYVIAQDEQEVMGVDDIKALGTAQKIFHERYKP